MESVQVAEVWTGKKEGCVRLGSGFGSFGYNIRWRKASRESEEEMGCKMQLTLSTA
ncbi:hypothetical protein ACLOJK_027024, partial [Asimina triloba]